MGMVRTVVTPGLPHTATPPATARRSRLRDAGVNALLLAGSANPSLGDAVLGALGARSVACVVERFPDGEVSVRLDEPVRGHEVVLLQGTSPPVNDSLVELLALADACRRAAAAHIVAVLPYFGYARSDRRDGRRTPVTASLVAQLMETAGIAQLVAVDVHTPALEGFFRIPVEHVTAIPLLADALRRRLSPRAVVVAPDLGAVRLATRYSSILNLPVAVCHKQRTSGADVSVSRITGDVTSHPCVLVDDMIATGATIVESVRALRASGATSDITVAATHAVLVPGALDRMAEAGVRELLVTDSIPWRESATNGLQVDIESIAPLLATAIERLLAGGSLRELA